jgi:exodeoxyribonuclease-3
VRIATYNVNGVTARLSALLELLQEERHDVVCLQELKTTEDRFPAAAIERAGYGAIWHGQKSWNGVSILARGCEPIETCRGLAGDPEDLQSRYIEAAVRGMVVASLYAPNGNPQPGPKFEFKLRWFARLRARAKELLTAGLPVVLAGDYNIIPTDLDVYVPERWRDDALFHPRVREAYAQLLDDGWTDAVRTLHPGERIYTFWKYLRNAYQRDTGLRIDHLLVSPALKGRIIGAGVDREHRGRPKSSDHAATWVELAEEG